jgi:hypothetical protein
MNNVVLQCLTETHNELWENGKDVGLQTKSSSKITKVWQEKLLLVDAIRFIPEYKVGGYKIDLADIKEGIAYELKVSPKNPHHEFYRDVFKIVYANSLDRKFDRFVFCCPAVSVVKLGALAVFVKSLSKQLNLHIDIFQIQPKQ